MPEWINDELDKDKEQKRDHFCSYTHNDILQRMGSRENLREYYKNQRNAAKSPSHRKRKSPQKVKTSKAKSAKAKSAKVKTVKKK